MSRGGFVAFRIAGHTGAAMRAGRVEGGPTRIAGHSLPVAHPANVRPGVAEDNGIGLKRPDQFPGSRPLIVGLLVDEPFFARAAVVSVAAVRAVVPDLENRPVTGEQLGKLLAIDPNIFRFAVMRIVAVPGRDIDAELETVA